MLSGWFSKFRKTKTEKLLFVLTFFRKFTSNDAEKVGQFLGLKDTRRILRKLVEYDKVILLRQERNHNVYKVRRRRKCR